MEIKNDINIRILALNCIFFMIAKYSYEFAEFYEVLFQTISVESLQSENSRKLKFMMENSLRTNRIPNKTQGAFLKVENFYLFRNCSESAWN